MKETIELCISEYSGVSQTLRLLRRLNDKLRWINMTSLDVYNHYISEIVKKRFRSLVGYGVCFTRRRSPVRSWAEPFFWNLLRHDTRPAANMCSAQNATGGEMIGYPTRSDVFENVGS